MRIIILFNGGTEILGQMKAYWDANLSNVDRNVAILFTAKDPNLQNTGWELYGHAYTNGGMINKSTSYMLLTSAHTNDFLTLIHEMGHLCGGVHDDCQIKHRSCAKEMML
ncbi:MAG: zinc-dependent metalloprotease [Parabacteroides sp.]|nr:zinc-dependent metalloprotease [Parabacteroides sp.]